ncbi:MAG: hypothetical protein NZ534_05945, partial [Bacteroidia bacterium]|nr:hypothetical protein [Bacteroidia bacterium]
MNKIVAFALSAAVFACHSCRKIQIAQFDVPFSMDFEFSAATQQNDFAHEFNVDANDYAEFRDNKQRLQHLTLRRASVCVKEVEEGADATIALSLWAADSTRRFFLVGR